MALRLMCVLAHPDDESLGTGGTLARYASEGVETYLVTATRGEKGRFGDSGGYQCQPADANCRLFDSRTIFPLAVEGTRYYWIERRRIAPAGGFVSAQTPTTYLSRFYDFEPLAATAKSSRSTARSSLASAAGESPR